MEEYVKNQGEVETGECLWLFFDIKKGLSGKSLLEELKNYPETMNWLCNKYQVRKISEINIEKIGENLVEWFNKNEKIKK